ncbi:MAG: hypothetical protein ACOYB1_09520 [Limnohabitans sp.]
MEHLDIWRIFSEFNDAAYEAQRITQRYNREIQLKHNESEWQVLVPEELFLALANSGSKYDKNITIDNYDDGDEKYGIEEYNKYYDSEIRKPLMDEFFSDQDSFARSESDGWFHEDENNYVNTSNESWGNQLQSKLDQADKESDQGFSALIYKKQLYGNDEFKEEINEPHLINEALENFEYEEDVSNCILKISAPNSLVYHIALDWLIENLKIKPANIKEHRLDEEDPFEFIILNYKKSWKNIIEKVFSRVRIEVEEILDYENNNF